MRERELELLKKQFKSMLPDIEEDLAKRAKELLMTGCISEKEYKEYLGDGDKFVLAKAIISAFFDDKPYYPPSNHKSLTLFKRLSKF